MNVNLNIKRISWGAAIAALFIGGLYAQGLTTTTLSSALTGTVSSSTPGKSVDVIQLASCSGLIQNSIGQWVTELYADFEAMDVVYQVSSSPCFVKVVRGASGTKATEHGSGVTVYVGTPDQFGGAASGGAALNGDKQGYCNGANEPVLPFINVNDGKIFNCYSSNQWVQTGFGTMGTPPGERVDNFCTGVVASAQTEFLNSAACSGATTATATRIMTSPGTLWGLQAYSSANVVGGSAKDVVSVFKNGSATAITCTIAASAATCSDTTHSVAVAIGDVITFQFVTATSDTAANVSASVSKQ